MKFVNESLDDILKPKSDDEIRKSLKNMIRWKTIVDGKIAPSYLKYFIDKGYIKNLLKKHGLSTKIITNSDKRILLIYDLFKKGELKDIKNDKIKDILQLWIKGLDSSSAINKIKSSIQQKFNELNRKHKHITGKNIIDEELHG